MFLRARHFLALELDGELGPEFMSPVDLSLSLEFSECKKPQLGDLVRSRAVGGASSVLGGLPLEGLPRALRLGASWRPTTWGCRGLPGLGI